MKPIIYSIFGNNEIASNIKDLLGADLGNVKFKTFPDGELYIRIHDDLRDKHVILVDSLNQPDDKMAKLLFFAETAKQEGAKQVGFICPYLSYMRQDKEFNSGEGITSVIFAQFISVHFSWLITVDPHLHRHKAMGEIYSIPTKVVHAASDISKWIKEKIKNPVLIGPDSESEQWVSEVAKEASAPFVILNKVRHGDRDVEISLPSLDILKNKTPVLVDDIISTASTMIKTIDHLKGMKIEAPICIGVHAVFAQDADIKLRDSGALSVVTCNTITHETNRIDLTEQMVLAVKEFV